MIIKYVLMITISANGFSISGHVTTRWSISHRIIKKKHLRNTVSIFIYHSFNYKSPPSLTKLELSCWYIISILILCTFPHKSLALGSSRLVYVEKIRFNRLFKLFAHSNTHSLAMKLRGSTQELTPNDCVWLLIFCHWWIVNFVKLSTWLPSLVNPLLHKYYRQNRVFVCVSDRTKRRKLKTLRYVQQKRNDQNSTLARHLIEFL